MARLTAQEEASTIETEVADVIFKEPGLSISGAEFFRRMDVICPGFPA